MENNKWSFDCERILRLIDKKYNQLNDSTLSDSQVSAIFKTIEKLNMLLNIADGTYINDLQSKEPSSFNVLKVTVLAKMKDDYNKIDHNLIDFISIIAVLWNVKYSGNNKYYQIVDPEIIINNSVEVYKEFIPELLPDAYKIINNPLKLINFSQENKIGSKCMYDKNLNVPFIEVEDSNHFPSCFIHELEHGIERGNNYKTFKFYKELGPILLETLYIDKMVEKGENNASVLYLDRLSRCCLYLDYLGSYFKVLKEFSKDDFNIPKGKFLTVLNNNDLAIKNRLSSLLDVNTSDYMLYLLSFFKSIEIRDYFYQDRKYAWNILKSIFEDTKNIKESYLIVLLNLERYASEIRQKQKSYYIYQTKSY